MSVLLVSTDCRQAIFSTTSACHSSTTILLSTNKSKCKQDSTNCTLASLTGGAWWVWSLTCGTIVKQPQPQQPPPQLIIHPHLNHHNHRNHHNHPLHWSISMSSGNNTDLVQTRVKGNCFANRVLSRSHSHSHSPFPFLSLSLSLLHSRSHILILHY